MPGPPFTLLNNGESNMPEKMKVLRRRSDGYECTFSQQAWDDDQLVAPEGGKGGPCLLELVEKEVPTAAERQAVLDAEEARAQIRSHDAVLKVMGVANGINAVPEVKVNRTTKLGRKLDAEKILIKEMGEKELVAYALENYSLLRGDEVSLLEFRIEVTEAAEKAAKAEVAAAEAVKV